MISDEQLTFKICKATQRDGLDISNISNKLDIHSDRPVKGNRNNNQIFGMRDVEVNA